MNLDWLIVGGGIHGVHLAARLVDQAGVSPRPLRWHPRLFVTGPLAELEIGPASRDIAGARMAARRVIPVAKREHAARSAAGQ